MAKPIFTITIIIILSSLVSISAQAYLVTNSCSGKGNYTENSAYKTNLVNLFSALVSAASRVRSYKATIESGRERVRAHFYCRRGFKLGACQSCVRDALSRVMQQCKNAREAIVWYEECTLSYGPGEWTVKSEMEESIPWAWWYSSHSVEEISNRDQFNQTLRNLSEGLTYKATSGNKPSFFAAGEAFVTILETLYGTVDSPSIVRRAEPATAVAKQGGQWCFYHHVK
ncbi:hypothetical protein Droror1_Dr00010533 [Drosera rotundifolia]